MTSAYHDVMVTSSKVTLYTSLTFKNLKEYKTQCFIKTRLEEVKIKVIVT